MLLLLTALALGAPVDLAPTLAEATEAHEVVARRLERAGAVAEALARVHNRWAELARSGERLGCDHAEASGLAPRSSVLGSHLRDEVQSARVELERAGTMASSATVVPLAGAELGERARVLRAELARLVRVELEMSAWHRQVIAPVSRACAANPAPGPGLARARDEPGPVAFIAVGGGVVCPMGVPADGRVVVAGDGRVCLDDGACGCTLFLVDPAAVLGPSP